MNKNTSFFKDALDYNPETGLFVWKVRPRDHFSTDRGWNLFNSTKAVKVAGTISEQGYLKINFGGTIHRAHRLAWLFCHGYYPAEDIDHINHIRSDNRISNLRIASRKENQRNQSLHRNNKSGHNGVHWRNDCQKWRAMIMVNGKSKHLGYFSNIEDAVKARILANELSGFHNNHGAST
ncbi:HNH endonuclease [Pseudocitrobacter faecalis]|uniref:HNH endonuclease n=1 Tax=Pseudocitrobacter faecalis TaxID=1398493 RepID=UPI003BA085E2